MFYCTNSTPIDCTINTDASQTDGSIIYVTQAGTAYVRIVAGSGVTLLTPDGNATRNQYSTIGMVKVDTATWLLMGDLGYFLV